MILYEAPVSGCSIPSGSINKEDINQINILNIFRVEFESDPKTGEKRSFLKLTLKNGTF